MKSRQLNIQSEITNLMFEHKAQCCGRSFEWKGPVGNVRYICQFCREEMAVTESQVRSEEEARMMVRNGHLLKEECADCGSRGGHEFKYDFDQEVYFLVCGECGEELREVQDEELHNADQNGNGD